MDAYCGLYCGACLCNIVSETGEIVAMAAKTGRTVAQLTCSDCKTAHMIEDCCFVRCCTDKGIQNCSECPDMPCEALTAFANDEYAHHSASITNLYRIREIGLKAWLAEQKQKYTCPDCGARLSWSSVACDQCGNV